MATRTLRTNNNHKPRPTHCDTCGRTLPKRAYRDRCATCIKRLAGKPCGEGIWAFPPTERAQRIRGINYANRMLGWRQLGKAGKRKATAAS